MKKVIFMLVALCSLVQARAIDYQNWMKQLPDAMVLSNMTWPGTHDSATKGFHANGETQKLTIQEQLESGIRAFDLRPGVLSDGTLRVFHSEYLYTTESMSDIFEVYAKFLKNHPSEALFVSLMKGAGEMDSYVTEINKLLTKYKSILLTPSAEPTLGQMRGKILVLSRNTLSGQPAGMYLSKSWSNNNTSDAEVKSVGGWTMKAKGQDIYDASKLIAKKKTDVAAMMTECAKGNTGKLFVNFVSGYTSVKVVDSRALADCAQQCNGVANDWLDKNSGPVGLIFMDFAGCDKVMYLPKVFKTNSQQLIDKLISNSYKTAENLYSQKVEDSGSTKGASNAGLGVSKPTSNINVDAAKKTAVDAAKKKLGIKW